MSLAEVAAGNGGIKFIGEAESDGAGSGLGAISDLTGDGRDEILIGASGNDLTGNYEGAVYTVFSVTDRIGLT